MEQGPIASPEEIEIRMLMIKETVNFLKENHITEHSKTGQLLAKLSRALQNKVIEHF
ncbi:hypothetical protein [Lactococcus lactis]|uniref:hypothetical protein n=1 Tax=Lactococcus lactis TaxID=1358 RepID=UPI0021A747CD|nr:hypothetical protein [Lactococcus lactis]